MTNQKVRPILDIGRRTRLGGELLYAQAKEYFHYLKLRGKRSLNQAKQFSAHNRLVLGVAKLGDPLMEQVL